MPSRQSYEVTVAGGGLGGLTAALAMRRRGLHVTVLEQAPELAEVGAGIQSAPNASRILVRLGLREKLEEIRTEPQDQVRRRWKDGSVIGLTPLGDRCKREFNAPYWHYHRADLHRVILDACTDPEGAGPPVQVEINSQVTDVDDSDPERPVAITADGRRYAADVLVGADGLKSRVRDAAGFPDTLRFSGEMAYRALIPGDKIAADPATRWLVDRFQSTIWYGPDRHLVHYMINGGEYLNVVAIVPCPPELASHSSVPEPGPGSSRSPNPAGPGENTTTSTSTPSTACPRNRSSPAPGPGATSTTTATRATGGRPSRSPRARRRTSRSRSCAA